MQDGVVVLHGIVRTYRSMRGLASHLERSGYRVLNLGYPSTRHPIEKLATVIYPEIAAFAETISGKLHFVGYSMGGLLIRAYLAQHRPAALGRIAMIGTPNYGSEVADYLQNWWLYRTIYGPAGQQLVTDQSSLRDIFAPLDCECGVIAGNKPIDFVSSCIIGKPNDGKVSIESTRLNGIADHIILPCSHTFFPANKAMWRQVDYFLKQGRFNRE